MKAAAAVAGSTRPVHQLAEPARFWIAYGPRSWRGAGTTLWTDLANARLEVLRPGHAVAMPDFDTDSLDDLFYLPPVIPKLAASRDRLAKGLLREDVPVLVQLRPGETCKAAGVQVVYDLLGVLLDGDVDLLAELPPGSAAVWPLVAGVSDRTDLWDEGCTALREAGVEAVQGMVVEIPPTIRRRIAEGRGDDVFDAIFHGDLPSERQFSICAESYGLEPFMRRPETGHTPRQKRNRRIAAELAMIGELWLRLAKPTSPGQAFFRAARGAESTSHDLAALSREGNLSILSWLDARSVEVIEEITKSGTSTLRFDLMEEYLGRRIPTPEEPDPEDDEEDDDEDDDLDDDDD